MTRSIPARLVRILVATLVAAGLMAAGSASAGAVTIAYSNLNTVAKTVNGLHNEDTYSLDYENFATGGEIELGAGIGGLTRTLTTEFDVFACEKGVYSGECITLKPKKSFKMTWTASIYDVGPGNSVGALLTSATATLKFHYRPSTNAACPATEEGKGFGPNCDVGGQKQGAEFKHFSPATPLPPKVIILLTNACGACSGVPVNVGLQASYKEFKEGQFIEEPAANEGIPSVGADPEPEDVYIHGELNEGGWKGFQPVFELLIAGR